MPISENKDDYKEVIKSESRIENPEINEVPAEANESSSNSEPFKISPGQHKFLDLNADNSTTLRLNEPL